MSGRKISRDDPGEEKDGNNLKLGISPAGRKISKIKENLNKKKIGERVSRLKGVFEGTSPSRAQVRNLFSLSKTNAVQVTDSKIVPANRITGEKAKPGEGLETSSRIGQADQLQENRTNRIGNWKAAKNEN